MGWAFFLADDCFSSNLHIGLKSDSYWRVTMRIRYLITNLHAFTGANMNFFTHIKSFLTRRPTARSFQRTSRNNLVELIDEMEKSSLALRRCILESRELRWRLQAQRTTIDSAIIENLQWKNSGQRVAIPEGLERELIVLDTNLVGLQYQESRLRDVQLRLDNKLKLFRYLFETKKDGAEPEIFSDARHATELADAKRVLQRADERLQDIRIQADATDETIRESTFDRHFEDDPAFGAFNPRVGDSASTTLFLEGEAAT